MKVSRTHRATIVALPLRPGSCRWCGCTYERPCGNGCDWMDRAQTLCTECAPLDRAIRTAKGRHALAEFLQDQEFAIGCDMERHR
jgi:hypothetical protein